MRAVVPTAIAHSACRALLLWAFLFCTQPGQTCVNGLVEATLQKRLGRLLQATTLVTSSGGIGSPPVKSTIFGSSLGPGWAVKSRGSRGVRQQQHIGAVSNGSQAFCATLPAKDVGLPTNSYSLQLMAVAARGHCCCKCTASHNRILQHLLAT